MAPLDQYLRVFDNFEKTQHPPGKQATRDHPSERQSQAASPPVPPPAADDPEGHQPGHPQAFGGARPRNRSNGSNDNRGHMPMGDGPRQPQHPMGKQPSTGNTQPPGGGDNSGNRARDNSQDNRRRRRNSSGSRERHDRHRGYDRSHSPPTAALEFERLNVLFLLRLIREDSLENVGPAIRLDPDALKELHDVRIPEVKSTIRDCRDATGKYASRRGCDTVLVRRAQIACQVAYEWTRQVLARYRRDQFHLGGNTPSREATFSAFDPHGDTSVYEFFMRFEEWSKGYLSSEAKADLLFNKYLPKSLTESYEELKARKRDYHAMRAWLIDQYGMIKRVCDAKIKLVKSLKPPKTDDDLVGQTL